MKVTILGSGTSTGIPMVGCQCPVCQSTDPRDQRTRSSILIEHGGRYILVDTTTDLRQQALRAQLPRVDAVLFTHAHADHVNGIDDLRGFHFLHRRVIPCYASAATLSEITTKFAYIFAPRDGHGYAQLLDPQEIAGPFTLFDLAITPLTFPHGLGEATGFRIGTFAYVTDCGTVPPTARAALRNLDLLIIDALRYTPHPNHLNIPAALEIIAELKPRLAVLTHLTHEVSCRDEMRLPPGVVLAHDGMDFQLGI
jgi:phosphoribosyl 1,2-cyclic phosphate phosphodiesterase